MSITSILRTNASPIVPASTSSRSSSVGFKAAMASASSAVSDDASLSRHSEYSMALRNNPDQGAVADIVKTMANTADGALVSVTGAPGDSVYYARTGEMVTPQSTSVFDARAQQVLLGRQAIYDEELAKGTPPADIYDKMADYMASLPDDAFKRQVTGWGDLD